MNSAAQLMYSVSRYDGITLLLTAALVEGAGADRAGCSGTQMPTTRQLRRISLRNSTSHLLSRPVSVSTLLRHRRLSTDAPVFQPSAIQLFLRSMLTDCGTICRRTSCRRRQCLFSGNVWRPISSVILSQISCSACTVTLSFLYTIINLFTYLLITASHCLNNVSRCRTWCLRVW